MAEGVSVGTSTYAVIDGIYNIGDGIIGMVSAVCDTKYDGAIPEVASVIAKKIGATKEQQEAVAALAGFFDAVIDAKATKGLSLVSKGKKINAFVKGWQTLDKINNLSGNIATGKQLLDVFREGNDVVKEIINNKKDEKENAKMQDGYRDER